MFREIAARNFAEGEAEGQAKGKAEGEARAVLTVLEARGILVPAGIKNQILACTDLVKLDTWLRRALTASSAVEVIQS